MGEIYCVSCKHKTGTKNAHKVATKNNRHRLAGTCSTCGKKKSMMVGAGWGNIFKGIAKSVAPSLINLAAGAANNAIAGSGVRRRKGGALYA